MPPYWYNTSSTWYSWASTNSATTTTTDPWYSWTSSTYTASTTWGNWVRTYTPTAGYADTAPAFRMNRSEANEAIQRERDRRWSRERSMRRQADYAARRRARILLREHLTPEQWASYQANKEFVVTARSGRRYLIKHGLQHNVFEIDAQGNQLYEYCVYVTGGVPIEDNLLGQKLQLEWREEEFREKANVWDVSNYDRADWRSQRPLVSRSGQPFEAAA